MTNLQKIGKLYEHFASCDWGHNNNKFKIEAFDNGFQVEIEFDYYVKKELQVNESYKFENNNLSIRFDKNVLTAFVFDFGLLDELLTKIFTEVVKCDFGKLSTSNKNSEFFN